MIKFTYMASRVATFSTLYDDIWRGLPITRNLRLPEEEYYNGHIVQPPAARYLLDNQDLMRDANNRIKRAKHHIIKAINNRNSLNTPKVGETVRPPKLTRKSADALNEILHLMQERNIAKNQITQLARKYSNTPFNVRLRGLP